MARARRTVKQIAAKIVKLPTVCAKVIARVDPDSFRRKSRKQAQPASGAHCTVKILSQARCCSNVLFTVSGSM